MICARCKADKPSTEFYASRRTTCKVCVREIVAQHRAANIERIRAYDRRRGNRQPATYAAAYAAKHPERRAAHVKLGNAVRDGRIDAWPVCAMPECDCTPEAHHTHYDAPLVVVWLCAAHHKQAHALAKRAA